MKLAQRVELLHRSSQRMMDALELPRDLIWWGFMSREVWLHFKRTVELLWAIRWRKE